MDIVHIKEKNIMTLFINLMMNIMFMFIIVKFNICLLFIIKLSSISRDKIYISMSLAKLCTYPIQSDRLQMRT